MALENKDKLINVEDLEVVVTGIKDRFVQTSDLDEQIETTVNEKIEEGLDNKIDEAIESKNLVDKDGVGDVVDSKLEDAGYAKSSELETITEQLEQKADESKLDEYLPREEFESGQYVTNTQLNITVENMLETSDVASLDEIRAMIQKVFSEE